MRLKGVREALRMSQTEFAEAIGLNRSSLSLVEAGKRSVPKSARDGLLKLKVNPAYVYEGVGDMLLESTLLASTGKAVNFAYQEVPFVTIPARAGFAEHFGSSEEFKLEVFPMRTGKKVDFAFEVEGDSMDPLLTDGDVVFTRKVENADFIYLPTERRNTVYVVVFGHSILIKHLAVKDEHLELYSVNSAYQTVRLEFEKVRAIFKVVGSYQEWR